MTDPPSEELPLRDEIFQRMDELTPAERKVARTLLARYPAAGLESSAALAAAAGTSKPTVLRLLARLGFGSYPDFQQRLRTEVTRSMSGSPLSRARDRRAAPSGDSVFLRAVEQRAQLVTRLQRHCAARRNRTSRVTAGRTPEARRRLRRLLLAADRPHAGDAAGSADPAMWTTLTSLSAQTSGSTCAPGATRSRSFLTCAVMNWPPRRSSRWRRPAAPASS